VLLPQLQAVMRGVDTAVCASAGGLGRAARHAPGYVPVCPHAVASRQVDQYLTQHSALPLVHEPRCGATVSPVQERDAFSASPILHAGVHTCQRMHGKLPLCVWPAVQQLARLLAALQSVDPVVPGCYASKSCISSAAAHGVTSGSHCRTWRAHVGSGS
jgi:hypothetical protein